MKEMCQGKEGGVHVSVIIREFKSSLFNAFCHYIVLVTKIKKERSLQANNVGKCRRAQRVAGHGP